MTVEGDKLANTSWESALGPKAGVPWATDDQWASLKSEATRMSVEMEAKANAPEARRPVSRLNTTKPKLQPEEMKPAGETSMVSVYWEPAKGIPDKDIVATNPYEGALGPGLIEGTVAQSLFKRGDASKLIKTPVDVWRNGKPATTTHSGTLPGSHSELRATVRTPSYMRGLPEERRRAITQEASFESTVASAGVVAPELSRSSARSLDRTSDASSLAGTGPARRPTADGGVERQVMELKGEYSRLRKVVAEKEVEIERLHQAKARATKDAGLSESADGDVEEYRGRAWTRIEMLEDRLEQVNKHTSALEEVQRRLKLVNKGLDHRLEQTKSELRQYNNDSREMTTMSKEVDASREEFLKRSALLRKAMEEDAAKRGAEITRRQLLVERSLAETNKLGEKVKAAEEEREKLEAEREAELQLAEMRSSENGTSVEEELEEIRVRKEERAGGGRLKKALQTIYERANTLSPEGALDWLGGRMKDHAEMVRRREEAEMKLESVRRQDVHSSAARRAHEVPDGGEAELEGMLADIEAFGQQSEAVSAAMNAMALDYVDWAGVQIAKLVRASDDVKFLQAARRLTRKMPRDGVDDEEAIRDWVTRAMPLVHSATHDLLKIAEADQEKRETGSPGAPPSGPASGAQIRSVGGSQTLGVVSNRGVGMGGGGSMEVLAPHEGFQAASASLV